ncbi:hypothetical protein AK812_SmicGene16063 [Symbiodinium microadriaticum]|uniref:Uncharacterized protein n=1 Tax=Symbiodinium microadriaticum TaxID=2951 RepID=A0A1Q9E1C5_SYMMI|nr:hypothetical protein AK812_SmicGene16063 [Symbiodinium microadriaticum]
MARGLLKYLATPATPTMTLRALSLLPPVAFELGADLVAAMESQQDHRGSMTGEADYHAWQGFPLWVSGLQHLEVHG